MDAPTFDGTYVPECYQVRSGLSFQPLNFGVKAPAKVYCVFRPIVTADFGIVTAHFGR